MVTKKEAVEYLYESFSTLKYDDTHSSSKMSIPQLDLIAKNNSKINIEILNLVRSEALKFSNIGDTPSEFTPNKVITSSQNYSEGKEAAKDRALIIIDNNLGKLLEELGYLPTTSKEVNTSLFPSTKIAEQKDVESTLPKLTDRTR